MGGSLAFEEKSTNEERMALGPARQANEKVRAGWPLSIVTAAGPKVHCAAKICFGVSANRGSTLCVPTVRDCTRSPPSSRNVKLTEKDDVGSTGKTENTRGEPKTMSRAGLFAGHDGDAGTAVVSTCHVGRPANHDGEACEATSSWAIMWVY
jgi:hypothetical protein